MADIPKIIWSTCGICSRETRHEIIKSKQISNEEGYRSANVYMMLQCCGCQSVSFKEDYEDYEQGHYDYDNEYVYPITTTIYPKVSLDHKPLSNLFGLPKLLRAVYMEVVFAIREDSRILAGLGLRIIVETMCNDKKVGGANLEKRIFALESKGVYI